LHRVRITNNFIASQHYESHNFDRNLVLSLAIAVSSMTDPIGDAPRIAVVVCFFNAGVTTTGLQIAKAVVKESPDAEFRFFSWDDSDRQSTYEDIVRKAGFEVTKYGDPLNRAAWNELLQTEQSGKSFQDIESFKRRIQACVCAMKEYQPHVIIHGILPDAAVASQLLGIPNVQYGPIPFDREYRRKHMFTDIPDSLSTWFTRLWPRVMRQWFVQWMLQQQQKKPSLISRAAMDCGWHPKNPNDWNVFGCATCNLVADLPSNYVLTELSSNTMVIGPVFADNEMAEKLPSDVERFLERSAADDDKPKVFVTMGSSGDIQHLVEAVKAVSNGEFKAVVALPPCRCTISELRRAIGSEIPDDSVVLTEAFVPARQLASFADVIVGHGGRGTKQTAMAAGTPMVGVGLQFEQEFNLENAVRAGAAIRLPKWQWKADLIRQAIWRLVKEESFKTHAKTIAQEMASFDSEKEAARIVLQTLAMSREQATAD